MYMYVYTVVVCIQYIYIFIRKHVTKIRKTKIMAPHCR